MAGLADRVEEGKSTPMYYSFDANMIPSMVISGESATEDIAKRVIVKCNKDFVSLDENVEGIEVKNGMCNDEDFDEWKHG